MEFHPGVDRRGKTLIVLMAQQAKPARYGQLIQPGGQLRVRAGIVDHYHLDTAIDPGIEKRLQALTGFSDTPKDRDYDVQDSLRLHYYRLFPSESGFGQDA